MKTVLVTGASGFVGRHCLLPLISRGYEVHAVSSKQNTGQTGAIQWHKADLLNPGETEALIRNVRPSHLLHLAWNVVHRVFWTTPDNMKWLQASLDLVQAFAKYGGKRLVIAGSCAEYDWTEGQCTEGITPYSPSSLYGACKRALHLVVDSFVKQTEISAAWGHIFFVYGPHEDPRRLVPSAIRTLMRSEMFACSQGNQVRDYMHVKDVADAFAAIVNTEVVGAVNIASGTAVTVREIVSTIATALKRDELIQFGKKSTPEGEPAVLLANCERLKYEIGWAPQYTLESGLRDTIAWWDSQQR